jgi:hypothetical protein
MPLLRSRDRRDATADGAAERKWGLHPMALLREFSTLRACSGLDGKPH